MKKIIVLPTNEVRGGCTPPMLIGGEKLPTTSTGEEVPPNDLNNPKISELAFQSVFAFQPEKPKRI